MPYTPQTWADGPSGGTPITADRLDVIEDGIAAATTLAEAALPKSGGILTGTLELTGAAAGRLLVGTNTAEPGGGVTNLLDVRSGSAAVGGAYFKHMPTAAATAHALTARQAGTSGTGSALNIVSDNPEMSSTQVSGRETSTGTVKITHTNGGTTATADVNAAAVSIDLKKGTAPGTGARGLFITSTDGPTTGDLITARNGGGADLFRVTPTGGIVSAGPIIGQQQRCSLSRIADLALAANVVTAVPIVTSVYQEGGAWWTAGANITVPTGAGGLYLIGVRVIFKDGGTNLGERSMWVRRQTGGPLVDDPPVVGLSVPATGTAIWPDMTASNVAPLVAGQTYYVSVRTSIAITLYGVEVSFTRQPVV